MAAKEAAKRRNVVITAKRVFLPQDLSIVNWANATQKPYPERERLELPADLATMLVERGQAEFLD
jgi:hypothetical protein